MTQQFNGFSQQGLNFLQQVRIENDKEWFEANRGVYDSELLTPFRSLVAELSPAMLAIDPCSRLVRRSAKRCRAFTVTRVFPTINRVTAAACG